jgi:hypothetical protein
MNNKLKLALLGLAAAVVAIAATVVGYQDWQTYASPPALPGTGFYRTWADAPSGLIKCVTYTGANCFFESGSGGLTLETNSVLNSSQSLLNLIQGSNIALTDTGGGAIRIDAAALSLLLKTNGVDNGSQSILNLQQGTGMTLVDDGSGTITLSSSAGATFQTNGVNNATQTLLNLQQGSGITLANSGGQVTVTATATAPLRGIGMTFGTTGGSALAATSTQYVTSPFACTLKQWDMTVDAGTATVDVWKIASATADWSGASGTVNTSGTAVTWVSGTTFPTDAAGQQITINSVAYTVASVTSSTALVLTSSAGVQSAVAFSASSNSGIPTVSNTIVASAYPAISSGTAKSSGTLTGWTTSVYKDDIFGFNIKAVSGGTAALSIVLECQQ